MLSVFSTRLAGFPTETHLLLPTFIFIILYTGRSWILFLVFSNSCGFISILLPAIVSFLFEPSSINFVPSTIYSYLFFSQNTIVFLKKWPFLSLDIQIFLAGDMSFSWNWTSDSCLHHCVFLYSDGLRALQTSMAFVLHRALFPEAVQQPSSPILYYTTSFHDGTTLSYFSGYFILLIKSKITG